MTIRDDWYTTVDGIFTKHSYHCEDTAGFGDLNNSGTGADLIGGAGLAAGVFQNAGPFSAADGADYCVVLDGTDDDFNASSAFLSTATEGTLLLAIRIDAAETLGEIWSVRDLTDLDELTLLLSGSNLLFQVVTKGTVPFDIVDVTTSGVDVSDGNWHLVIVRQKADGTGPEIYVDNVLRSGSVNLTGNGTNDDWCADMTFATTPRTIIGQDGNNANWLDADYHTIGWHDAAISDAQLQELWDAWTAGTGAISKTIRRRNRRIFAS